MYFEDVVLFFIWISYNIFMGIKDEFKKKFRAGFVNSMSKKMSDGKDPLVNGIVIGNLIDAVKLTEEDVLALVAKLCRKYDMHPIVYKKSTIKFALKDGIEKISFTISNYN